VPIAGIQVARLKERAMDLATLVSISNMERTSRRAIAPVALFRLLVTNKFKVSQKFRKFVEIEKRRSMDY